ncbi:MAG: hypothetical protein H0X65_03615 [Gemmatimonadetes bacterium]|nr:hypothetical protein [Gemmatimonadota bacterium]
MSLVSALLVSPVFASAQEAQPLRVTTRAAEITIGGRAQTLFSTTNVDRFAPAEWELRRIRLEFGVRVNEAVGARIQPEFGSARVGLRDAYAYFGASPAFEIWAGQAFRPFSAIAQTSSTRILPIERGVRIRGVTGALDHHNLLSTLGYADRDVGIQVRGRPRGAPLGITYAAGVFNGPLQGQTSGEVTYQLAARATANPRSDLRLGAGWSRRDFGLVTGADAGEIDLRGGSAYQVDVEYGSYAPGFHLVAEAATGVLNPFANREAGQTTRFRSAQLWTAYRTRPLGTRLTHIEPVFRVSYGDPDAGRIEPVVATAGGLLLTPGFNLYFGPLNRVMINYDLWSPNSDVPDRHSLKAMFQVAF